MPVRICTVDELTPHIRGRKAAFDEIPELKQLQTKLANGLKPYEAIEVELPESSLKHMRLSFKRRVQTYIKSLKLNDLEVTTYAARGKEYVTVAHQPVLT